jgi:hypothetical protein
MNMKAGDRLRFRHPKFMTLYNEHCENWNIGVIKSKKGKLFIISDVHTPLLLEKLKENEHYVLINEKRVNTKYKNNDAQK